jgi:hypothetical protein
MKKIIKWAVAICTGLALLVTLLLLPGLPWSARCHRTIQRTAMKVKLKLATWSGEKTGMIALSGRLTGNGAFAEGIKGAQVIALESSSGYCAMSDGEGRFSLPHLFWYPDSTYHLVVIADLHHMKKLQVNGPATYPTDGIWEIGELRFDEGSAIAKSEVPIRNLKYERENLDFYRELFYRITLNAQTDAQKIDAICKYVATKHNPSETRWVFNSARQILEGGAPHCSNLAFAMAAITAAGGYPTRTVHTSDTPQYTNIHTVAEVYYENGWHLYDPTYGIHFPNRQGRASGYKELRMNPALIKAEAFGGINAETTVGALAWMPATYRSGIFQFYQVDENSFASECSWLATALP